MAESADGQSNWWESAIIYAVDVDRFHDADGDGVGDFKGLTEKVPYLAELGVTCIWLLPFFPSGGRDNGYDVTDYYEVDRRYGTLEDFIGFVHRAGEHGIRVLVDLVMQHTSSRHPWFLAARQDNESRYRGYYLWSENPDPLPPGGVGSVFPGEQNAVWTYDDTARAYYHHNFYDFEPGLNTDSAEVRREIERVMDFWLCFGIGGFRVDAARYMVRLPLSHDHRYTPPHQVLHEIYDYAKGRRPNAVMLGEVDAGREDIMSYFDDGQFDTMFNFMLCSYLFLGLAEQSAEPVRRGLECVPEPPEGREWVTMLRNLDEANLEWLDRDDRERVFAAFAPKEEMRIYDRGMRRRLAPMLEGDPQRLKLAYSLLFSLPGTPLIPYGDEIGLGENMALEGRNAVRLPMQWSAAKNGGFSDAPASRLDHAPSADGPFGYKRVNVEEQRKRPDSLFHHIRHLIKLRRGFTEFDRRHFELLDVGSETVLAHRYRGDRRQVVMLHNLAAEKTEVTLQIDPNREKLCDLLSEEVLTLEKGRMQVTLPGYGFSWFATPEGERG